MLTPQQRRYPSLFYRARAIARHYKRGDDLAYIEEVYAELARRRDAGRARRDEGDPAIVHNFVDNLSLLSADSPPI